jgi:hypothetical protein
MTTDQPSPEWRKSSFASEGDDFVEVANTPEGIAVRHSKRPDAKTLLFTKAELAAFIAGCKAGEFDDIR